MSKITFYSIVVLLTAFAIVGFQSFENPPYITIPQNWPKPIYAVEAISPEGFELGRKLFYDPILSRDNTISCASCHFQATAFTHVDHDLSHGIDGKIGTRNALTLQNLIWNKTFMWDGGVNHLEVQPIHPITSPLEMDETFENCIDKLKRHTDYVAGFKKVFKSDKITGQFILKALSQFMAGLITANAKYDKVIRHEAQFSDLEAKGYALFQRYCVSCHQEPLFASTSFEYNGLPMDADLNDVGRMRITQNPADSLKFKVPTLRNIEFSFPYMHDGRFKTLNEVLHHYSQDFSSNPRIADALRNKPKFTDEDRVALISFLKTLTDKEFLFNPKFSYPKK